MKMFRKYPLFLFVIILVSMSIGVKAETEKPVVDRVERHQARFGSFLDTELRLSVFAPGDLKLFDYSDIQISETISPSTFSQKFSSIASMDEEKVIICWEDNRLGSRMVFSQILDANGDTISTNDLIFGRDDGYNVIEPKVVSDKQGGFYVAWRDETSGRIYASRYDKNNNRIVPPFIVTDTMVFGFSGPFDIDCYFGGELVVVWENYSMGNFIALRIFDSDGTPLTPVITVNSDGGDNSHWVPSVAVDTSNNMAVVWEDYRYGNADIHMQYVNIDGSLWGNNFGLVEGAYDDSAQYLPEIIYSPTDGHIITWLDRRDGSQRVYLQRVIRGSGLEGDNVMISDGAEGTQDWDISMAANSSGNISVVWASIGSIDRILIQRFSPGVIKDGAPIIANTSETTSRWETALVYNTSDNIYCSWSDFRFGHSDIFLNSFTEAGLSRFTEDKLINDDTEGANSTEPDLVVIDETKGVVLFTDTRNDAGDIFMQQVDVSGSLIGSNIKVNSDALPVLQSEPSVAVSSTDILIVWNDCRAVGGVTGQRIFARFADHNSVFAGPEFVVSDTANISAKTNPAVAITPGGKAFAVWIENISGDDQILGRVINPDGSFPGGIISISQSGSELDNKYPIISVDDNNIFTVVWLTREESTRKVIMARYDINGDFINRFGFVGDKAEFPINEVSGNVKSSGEICLLWQGVGMEKRLFLTVLDSDGTIVNSTIEVVDNIDANPRQPDLFIDENNNVITSWIDIRSGRREIYYQLYNQNLTPIGTNSPASPGSAWFMSSPTVAGTYMKAWIAWTDPRNGGLNILLSQIDYNSTDIDENDPAVLPTGFRLEQNYPNPFNPTTTIEFSLANRSHVKISVFDLLGREVATIINKFYDSGCHTVIWDGCNASGKNVSSGIYFYKMEADDIKLTRKMILIK